MRLRIAREDGKKATQTPQGRRKQRSEKPAGVPLCLTIRGVRTTLLRMTNSLGIAPHNDFLKGFALSLPQNPAKSAFPRGAR